MPKFCKVLILVAGFVASNGYISTALAVSDAQIQQFKRLPQAQQQALAEQFGVDLGAATQNNLPPAADKLTAELTIAPRAVEKQRATPSGGQGLDRFGYELFAGEPLSLSPLDDLPVPDDYVVGPGDEIAVKIFGKKEDNFLLVVNREGSIDLPSLGPFAARGLTYQQLKQELTDSIKRRMIGVEVTVSLGRLKTIQVFVLGEAHTPGAYVVSSMATVTQALQAAGGISQLGSLRDIQLKRKNKIVRKIDLYDLLIAGNTRADTSLKQGDVVFIPVQKNSVAVHGRVKRPAIYEFKAGASLASVIDLAGGLRPSAASVVKVERMTRHGTDVFTIDLANTGQAGRFRVANGDAFYIGEVFERYNHAVTLVGAVVREGSQPWYRGATLSDLIKSIDLDLLPSADLEHGLLVREQGAERHIKVLHFNMLQAISQPKSSFDPELQPRDQIIVLNKALGMSSVLGEKGKLAPAIADQDGPAEIRIAQLDDNSAPQNRALDLRVALLKPVIAQLKAQADFESVVQIVDIQGAVKFPGVYPLFEHADIRTLVGVAGGLQESSYLPAAELSRFVQHLDANRMEYHTINIAAAMRGELAANLALQSKDSLHVFTKPEWREDYQVTLSGEVRFPGAYSFNRGETLYDVIQRAGGLSEFAYAQGAVFARESLRKIEVKQLEFLHNQLRAEVSGLAFRRQSVSNPLQSNDVKSALDTVEQLGVVEAVGRMSINLDQILAREQAQDINLEHGDRLHVPPLRKVVSVLGQVQFPTSHIYEAGKTVDDYLELSGGSKKQADPGRVYVIRANGSVFVPNQSFWFKRGAGRLQPGDSIVMPMDTDYLDGLTAWTSATQIMYQLGVAWSAISD